MGKSQNAYFGTYQLSSTEALYTSTRYIVMYHYYEAPLYCIAKIFTLLSTSDW